MKRSILIFVVTLISLSFFSFSQTITTQGVLRDDQGYSVDDGTYDMTFTIYDAETGGNQVWQTQKTVQVTNGVYNAILGSAQDPLNMLDSDKGYWLGVKIGTDQEMTPRLKLNLSPYEFAKLSGDDNVFPAAGDAGIGTTSPASRFDIYSGGKTGFQLFNPIDVNGSEGALMIGNSTTGLFLDANEIQATGTLYINNDNPVDLSINNGGGKVGVGTSSPTADVHVKGRVYVDSENFGGTPVIDLPVGDTDTGLDSKGDGRLDVYCNNLTAMEIRGNNVNVPGTFKVAGSKPFEIRRFSVDNQESYDWKLPWRVQDGSAVVVGWDAGICNTQNTSYDEWSWKVLIEKNSDGYWHLTVEGHTEGNHPDWTVDVMFIRFGMIADYR